LCFDVENVCSSYHLGNTCFLVLSLCGWNIVDCPWQNSTSEFGKKHGTLPGTSWYSYWYQVPGTHYLLVPGTGSTKELGPLVPGTWYQVPGSIQRPYHTYIDPRGLLVPTKEGELGRPTLGMVL